MRRGWWRRRGETPIIIGKVYRSPIGRRADLWHANETTPPSQRDPISTPARPGQPRRGRADRRLLLSADAARAGHAGHHASDRPVRSPVDARTKTGHAASSRVTPAQEINNQYAQFLAAFQTVGESYVQSLNESSTGTTTVSATLTAPYLAGTASMQVNDAAVFGPAGIFATPITATAGGHRPRRPVRPDRQLGKYRRRQPDPFERGLAGQRHRADGPGDHLRIEQRRRDPPQLYHQQLAQLAVKLVTYFNSLPFKLPRMFALPHQEADRRPPAVCLPGRGGCLSQQPRAQPSRYRFPRQPGATFRSITPPSTRRSRHRASRCSSGVEQIFAHKLQVVPSSTLNSSTSTGGTSSTSTGGTSSTSTGTA